MTRFRSLTSGFLVLAAAVASFASDSTETLKAAQAAYASKNFAEALKLYEQVAAADPNVTEAVFRAGELKSWGIGVAPGAPPDYKGAIARFDQLLARNPKDQFSALAKARCLLWSGERAQAAQVALGVLKYAPRNREAHMTLGNVYLSLEQYPEARNHFQAILTLNDADSDALVGMARTYHYAFAHDRSRAWYEKALAQNPQNREALFGLAWSEYAADPEGAARRADDLARRFPEDNRAASLRAATRTARSAFFSLGGGHISDTANNDITGTEASAELPVGERTELKLSALYYSMESSAARNRTLDATASSFGGSLTYATGRGQRLSVRGAIDHRKGPGDTTQNKPAGGAAVQWGLGRVVGGRVSFDHDNFRYTPESIAAEVELNKTEASVGGRVVGNLFADGSASHWGVSSKAGDTDRNAFGVAARYRFKNMDFGYGFEHSKFGRDLGVNGFFTPTRLQSHRLEFRLAARYRDKVSFFLSARGGTQTWTAGPATRRTTVEGDEFIAGNFTVAYRLSKRATLDFSGNRNESGVGETAGLTTNSLSVRLRVSARNPW